MVVGRRRVAAASVATAYALHVYVLPNTIFDRPKPAIPPTHPPNAEKLVCTRVANTSRGCWCCTLSHSLEPPRPFQTLRRELHVLFSRTYIRSSLRSSSLFLDSSSLFLALTSDAPSRTPSLALVHPRLSIRCSLFLFLRLAVSLLPYTRIEVVDIVLRSVSKLRENDRPASHVVWLVCI